MKPTIGRIVLFHPTHEVTQAAIVAHVHSETMVNLAVFDSNGVAAGVTSVQLVQPGQPKPEFGRFCEWMPYQVDQAKKIDPTVTFTVQQKTAEALERIIQEADEKALTMDIKTSTPENENAIEQQIQAKALTAARVTPDYINTLMDRVQFTFHVKGTSTFCYAFLDGEFYLATGHSACVSKSNFNEELGEKIAKENVLKPARDKLWELEGYALRLSMQDELSHIDAVLGKQVRVWAEKLKAASVQLDRPEHMTALMMLIEMMVDSNAGEMDVKLEEVTMGDRNVGDWTIQIVRQTGE